MTETNSKSLTVVAIVSAVVALALAGVAAAMYLIKPAEKAAPEEPVALLMNGHEYVDLGLSVMWATCNIGAAKPAEFGDLFAWGETTPKTSYGHGNYVHGKQDFFYKYVPIGQLGFSWDYEPDNRLVLEFQDDAAAANWGNPWRMPTTEEIQELASRCTSQWTTVDGHAGMLFTGPNGNSIFMPAAGIFKSDKYENAGTQGFYWSSSLKREDPKCAYRLFFDAETVGSTFWNGRYYGINVRGVIDRNNI